MLNKVGHTNEPCGTPDMISASAPLKNKASINKWMAATTFVK